MKSFVNIFSNETLLVIFGVSFILMVISFFIPFHTLENLVGAFFQYSGLFFLLKNNRLIYEHQHVRLMYLFFASFLIGALFKLESWFGADYILIFSATGIAATYVQRYISKQEKSIVDVLKVLWAVIFCASVIFNLMSWPYQEILSILNFGLFFSLVAITAYKLRVSLFKSR